MKNPTTPATYPTGAASIPLVRGWRGLVVMRTLATRELSLGWECPHDHKYSDTAVHCAGVTYRRWLRTGEHP